MKQSIILDGGLKGHLARSLVVVAVTAAIAFNAAQDEARREQLRDAVASAPVQVLPAPERLPTDYNPPKDGLMLLSEAQIAEFHARSARIKRNNPAQGKKQIGAAKRIVPAPKRKAPAVKAEVPRLRWSGIRGVAADFPELDEDSRRTP